MLNDSGGDDGLPLLAVTLREMYDHFGDDGRLDAEEYRELGGLAGALARVADDVVESQRLTTEQEDELRRAFLAMARLTDDDRWVRQVVRWDQLPSSLHPVLERFVTARLLVSSGDPDARTLDIAHEALFRSWHRLAGWLEKHAEAFRLRRELENASGC
jgi:hypothetical protein